jgi:thioredoxin reductase
MTEYDVVIIGGGAAGLSAALVLARARRTVLVVDAGRPRNAPAAHMHGFLSRDGMAPADLLAVGRAEVQGYGGQIVPGEVVALTPSVGGFALELGSGAQLRARRLLVATGLRDELPDLAGLRERWGRDVLHCPYCHGYEVRGQRLGVLGGPPGSVRYAQIVRQWSPDVVFFVPNDTLAADERAELSVRGIRIVEGDVHEVVVTHDRLEGVAGADGSVVPIDALFVPPRFVPHHDLLVALGCDVADSGWVRTDPTGQTSVSGVWAAGNVVNPRAQVITAAGEGSAAAIAINADLVDEDVRDAVRNSHDQASA